jgi:hypothetical protein
VLMTISFGKQLAVVFIFRLALWFSFLLSAVRRITQRGNLEPSFPNGEGSNPVLVALRKRDCFFSLRAITRHSSRRLVPRVTEDSSAR